MPTYIFTFQTVVDGDTIEDATDEARRLVTDERYEPSNVELEQEDGTTIALVGQVIRTGYDGMLVTFGDGTDDDTLNMTLFHYPMVGLTLVDGRTFDAFESHATWSEDHQTIIEYQPVNDDGEPEGVRTFVALDLITGVEIY